MAQKVANGAMELPGSKEGLAPNARVEIVGLQDRPELNHVQGTIVDFNHQMLRWRVSLDGGSKKMFKHTNLRCLVVEVSENEEPKSSTQSKRAAREGGGGSSGGLPSELLQELLSPADSEPTPTPTPTPPIAQTPAAPVAPAPQPSHVNNLLPSETPPDREKEDNFRTASTQRMDSFEKKLDLILSSLSEQQSLLDGLLDKEAEHELMEETRRAESEKYKADMEKAQASIEENRVAVIRVREKLETSVAELRQKASVVGDDDIIMRRLNILEQEVANSKSVADDSLSFRVDVLQDCIKASGLVSDSVVQASTHRRSFEAVRRSTGWYPGTAFVDLAEEEETMLKILGFLGPASMQHVWMALGPWGTSRSSKRTRVQISLQRAALAVQDMPNNNSLGVLQTAINVAASAGLSNDMLDGAQEILYRGHFECALAGSATPDEVAAAARLASKTSLDARMVEEMVAAASYRIVENQKAADAQRKLRIALAWASKKNPDSLKKAIEEAEEANVLDPDEVNKARLVYFDLLESCQSVGNAGGTRTKAKKGAGSTAPAQASAATPAAAPAPAPPAPPAPPPAPKHVVSLLELLRDAKPNWTNKDLDSALAKLSLVGVFNVAELQNLLKSKNENQLNEMLKQTQQRVFNEDTMKALRTAAKKACGS